MTAEQDENLKRWKTKCRFALVLDILRGETSVAEAARKHALTVAEIEEWRDRFLLGAENALRSKPLNDEAQKTQEIQTSQAKGWRARDGYGHPQGGH